MSRKFKPPKPLKGIVKQMPAPTLRTGPPLVNAEHAHKVMGKLASEGDFQNIDELSAHLQRQMASGELDRMMRAEPETPAERAQELVYRAMDEPSPAKARKLAEQALKLDPDCVDAMVIRAQSRKLSMDAYIAELLAAVKAGERVLGEERLREDRGHFWGLIETRPYMRARRELAMALAADDKLRDAADEFEGMLELNPNDNQGVRDYLLGIYLALNDLEGAASLFRQYEDDGSAVFAWGRVFLLMLLGKRAEAAKALEEAFRVNRYTPVLFFSSLVPEDPPSWGIGDEDEAEHSAMALLPAVTEHPDVVVWIGKQAVNMMERILAEKPLRRKPRVH